MTTRGLRLTAGLVLVTAGGCDDSGDAAAGSGIGTGQVSAGAPADDGNGGGDSSDAGDDGVPPEMEEEADFRVPRASGRWVFSASETTDSVAVIDSQTLGIDVVGVGRGPTVIAPLAAEGQVAVLDQGSDDVALLATSETGTAVTVIPTSAGANNLAPTPDGAFVFVYHDVDGPEQLGPGSDQELTVIDGETLATYAMTVGVHPRHIAFTSDSATAYVVTDDGVNVVTVADLAMVGKPDLVPVVSDPGIDPSTLEVHVAPEQAVALARIEGQDQLFATDLESGAQFVVPLPSVATDLDVDTEGRFAIATLPSTAGSAFAEVTLPLSDPPQVQIHPVEGAYVGLAQVAPDGETMLLYTTVNPFGSPGTGPENGNPEPTLGGTGTGTGSDTGASTDGTTSDASSDSGTTVGSDTGDETGAGSTGGDVGDPTNGDDPRVRVTIARRGDGSWNEQITLFVDRPVAAVGIAPDSNNAVLLHDRQDDDTGAPWAYTLIDLTKDFPVKKLQTVAAEPGPVLFTPEGARAVVLMRDDEAGLRHVDRIDLNSFIVEGLALGSPPEGAGYVPSTEKIFVSQEHPTGRITFIDGDNAVETVTGFRLNSAVKD